MGSKIKSISLSMAIIFALFFCSCDPHYQFDYYLYNQTEDTIMFKWFKDLDMCNPRRIASDSATQQSIYDTVYVLPPNKKNYILRYAGFLNNENNADIFFENQLKCISCFGPILFKDGNSIQYSRNCTYPKNFYNAYSFFAREGRTDLCFKYIYYVTEEDYQQSLEGKRGNSDH